MDNNNDEKSTISPGNFETMLGGDSEFKRLFADAVFNVRTCFENLFETDEYKNFRQQYEKHQIDLDGISSGMLD